MKAHPLVGLDKQEHKNPVIRWLMGDSRPTRLEFYLSIIGLGVFLVYFVASIPQ